MLRRRRARYGHSEIKNLQAFLFQPIKSMMMLGSKYRVGGDIYPRSPHELRVQLERSRTKLKQQAGEITIRRWGGSWSEF